MNDKLQAEKDCVVRFHYVLRDDKGKQLDSSGGGEPAAALMGHDNLMPGLERSLEGHAAGDTYEVTLDPADAFGERRENWTQRVSKKYLAGGSRLKAGMQTQVSTDAGPRAVTVIKVGGKFVDVDLNHPLAGKSVTLEVEVVDVRQATADEVAHGHAHGAGGHQH